MLARYTEGEIMTEDTVEIPTLQAFDDRPGSYYVTAADQVTRENDGEVFIRTALLVGPFGTHRDAETMLGRVMAAIRRSLSEPDRDKFLTGAISFGVTRLPDGMEAPPGPMNPRYGYVPQRAH